MHFVIWKFNAQNHKELLNDIVVQQEMCLMRQKQERRKMSLWVIVDPPEELAHLVFYIDF